jgi:hypothetical protein
MANNKCMGYKNLVGLPQRERSTEHILDKYVMTTRDGQSCFLIWPNVLDAKNKKLLKVAPSA